MKKFILLCALAALAVPGVQLTADNCAALPAYAKLSSNGLALTPPMGWKTYYAFKYGITEAIIKNQADLLVSSGLAAAGYNYVLVGDGWEGGRDGSNNIYPNATNFPSGMAALASYIHADGLLAGIYSSPNTTTCGGYTGSGGYESNDATTFASWGFDYLTYDGCSVNTFYSSCWSADGPQVYQMMSQAVRTAGRDMVMESNIIPSPWSYSASWEKAAGYNEYRIVNTSDINGIWSNFDSEIDLAAIYSAYQQPGYWPDWDMIFGQTEAAGFGTFTETQTQTQMGLFALWSSPMILGMDISTLSGTMLTVLKNSAVIAVDQDSAGKMAARVSQVACGSKTCEVWAKPLHDGSWAIGLLNRDSASHTISVNFQKYGVNPDVHDLWAGTDLGSMTSYSTSVAAYGLAMLKATPGTVAASARNLIMQKTTIR